MPHTGEKAEMPGSTVRERSLAKLILVLLIVSALIASLWLLPVKDLLVDLLEWAKSLGWFAPVFVAGFYVLAAVLFLPGSVLTLGAGFLFGLPLGALTVWVGANLGACAAFLVGRTIARDWVQQKVSGNPKFAAMDTAVAREGFKIVLLLRLSPVFPYNFLNYALGLTRVPFSVYALATLIGMIPAMFMYVYLGSAARSLADVAAGQVEGGLAGRIFFWMGLAATVAVALFVTRIARRTLATVEGSGPDGEKLTAGTESYLVEEQVTMAPDDEHNQDLVANVHPPDWVNPEPADRYNLVVIGAGTAGLVTAAGAAGLGARVALVERHLLGGDCLNYGCVPSKALIRSSRVQAETLSARSYGIRVFGEVSVDFSSVMERVRRLRAAISHHDAAARFKDLGVDVFLGHARFTGPNTLTVGGKTLRFKKAVIATGARAVNPAIKGLSEAGFLTNETVFSLTELPSRLAVLGGGPLGCEMAQAFQRMGSKVVLFHKNDHLLDREDADAAEIIQAGFIKEGIDLILNSNTKEVEAVDGNKIIRFQAAGYRVSVVVDEILVAAGRAPNVEHLNLEAAGVQYDNRSGVVVNDYLQTTNPDIFAAGDICMNYKFTHAADAAARIVIQNALFRKSKRLSALTIPWCTYTDPEIAHVGMYERDAASRGIAVDTFFKPLGEVDRAIVDSEEEGFVKIHVRKGTDRILGATIVAAHAGEMISEVTLAMKANVGLRELSGVIHPYPTQAEAIKQAADAYNRTRLTPFLKKVLTKWFAWTR